MKNKNHHQWLVYDNFELASLAAANLLEEKIKASIQNKGASHIILPGGNSPVQCLQYLAEKNLPWDKIYWYLSDERCYPVGHAERNSVMLKSNFWSKLNNPNVLFIPAELGAEVASAEYGKVVEAVDVFDIAFLGMGEDGHTASLFPNNRALLDTRSVVPVYDAPKAPSERVSLSLKTLSNVKFRMVLTGGAAKAASISKIKHNDNLPINNIGDITWLTDVYAMNHA